MYETKQVQVLDSTMPVLVFTPDGQGPHPVVVVAQHLPVAHAGLENDPFQIDTGERYAREGFVCVMPYLFHWWPTDADMDLKRSAFRDDWTVADLAATLALLPSLRGADSDRVGIIGHCWGGRIAWLGACHEQCFKACVVCYGGRIKLPFADAAPAPITLAADMHAAFLGIFGNEDVGPSPADVDDYEAALAEAGVNHEIVRYDGAGHGFQDFTSADRYRPQQSADAWTRTIAFFERELRESP